MSTNGDDEAALDYHAANDQENKSIIQQLAEGCDDDDGKAVIKCYTIGSSNKDVRKQLKSHNVTPLTKAATYLGLNTNLRKEELITSIIRRIETLLKDLCGACGEFYNNSLQDQPFFSCLICNQGCHEPCYRDMKEVFVTMAENLRHSFPFICTKCYGDFSDDHAKAAETRKSPVKTKPRDEDIVSSAETHEGVVEEKGDDHDVLVTPTNPPTNVEICPRYKWGRCPEYDTCEFRHPPRCWNWLEKGKCSYKAKCKYHHPPLCHDSLNNKQCFNGECKYFHLKRTLRYRIDDEHLRDSLHSSNYHNQNQQPRQMHQNQLPPHASTLPHQQPQTYHAHPTSTRHEPPPSQPAPSQSAINHSDMSFLLQTIKGIKDDLGKEIAELKGNINARNETKPQVTTNNTVPQTLAPPNLYNIPNLMFPMQPQTFHQRY